MSPSEKGDLVYLLNILQYIGKIEKFTEKIKDAETFFLQDDQIVFDATLHLLLNIGENAKKIKSTTRQEYSNIDWQKIINFRNIIVHEYTGIDHIVVYNIVTTELKLLKQKIENIIIDRLNKGIFDMETIAVCKNNRYYQFVDFEEINVPTASCR